MKGLAAKRSALSLCVAYQAMMVIVRLMEASAP
jgi:hypothetical protein